MRQVYGERFPGHGTYVIHHTAPNAVGTSGTNLTTPIVVNAGPAGYDCSVRAGEEVRIYLPGGWLSIPWHHVVSVSYTKPAEQESDKRL